MAAELILLRSPSSRSKLLWAAPVQVIQGHMWARSFACGGTRAAVIASTGPSESKERKQPFRRVSGRFRREVHSKLMQHAGAPANTKLDIEIFDKEFDQWANNGKLCSNWARRYFG